MLESDVEITLKTCCFPNAEFNNAVSRLKIRCSTSRPKLNLKTTLKQRFVPAGPILKFKAFEEQYKSSDIEQQPPFGNKAIHCLKWSVCVCVGGGATKRTGTSYNFDKVWSGAPSCAINNIVISVAIESHAIFLLKKTPILPSLYASYTAVSFVISAFSCVAFDVSWPCRLDVSPAVLELCVCCLLLYAGTFCLGTWIQYGHGTRLRSPTTLWPFLLQIGYR